jgi:Domain of unknown function (DUF5658)
VSTLSKSCLLFVLNLFDAQLTLVWIRLNVATEGNALMAQVLSYGDWTFLGTKLAVGGFAAYVLYRCAHLPLAKYGLTAVLSVYAILMLVHAATGCVALGWHAPINFLAYLETLPTTFLGLFA